MVADDDDHDHLDAPDAASRIDAPFYRIPCFDSIKYVVVGFCRLQFILVNNM